MIWLDNSRSKKTILFILVFIFMIFIFWLWLKMSPWEKSEVFSPHSTANQSQASSTSPWDVLKNTWEEGKAQIANWQAAWQRQEKQQELLEAAKKYIEEHAASSTATSTATTTPQN